VDKVLAVLVARATRRGFAGEPVWLAVALAAWLVRRGRNKEAPLVWKGKVGPGERLVIATVDPRAPETAGPGGA